MRRLRIVHLFPDILRFYGDGGNIAALVQRAEARSIETSVVNVMVGASAMPGADLVFIGGGQDREQATVARELLRIGPALRAMVSDGAALLAVCGGYQNLGTSYRTSSGTVLAGPGLFPISTEASAGSRRLVGDVVGQASPVLLVSNPGLGSHPASRTGVVGFQNHAGRTTLEPDVHPFCVVGPGAGNNGWDRTEGALLLPGERGIGGLRLGTYLHGPLLPRNPHVADALIAAALARGGDAEPLRPLDDAIEWAAHEAARLRLRRAARRTERVPRWARRVVDPVRALIGY